MSANGKPEPYRLGFLTAIEVPDKGYVGGLLVTNHFGRPLEFQSTVPIKPNPTQEILYGPTLEPFLLGELIATTLIEKSGVKPHLVLTDREQILALREHISSPVAWVKLEDKKSKAAAISAGESAPVDVDSSSNQQAAAASDVSPPGTDPAISMSAAAVEQEAHRHAERGIRSEVSSRGEKTLKLGRQIIRFHQQHPEDCETVARDARLITADSDLKEPFDRVREALQETLKTGALR